MGRKNIRGEGFKVTSEPVRTLISGGKQHILTKEDSIKGGKSQSEAKRMQLLTNASKRAKCGNCKAMCILKANNPKGLTCPIPEARAFSIFYNSPVMDKGILLKLSHQTLLKIQEKSIDVKDLKQLHSAQMEQLKTEHGEKKTIEGTINHNVRAVTINIVQPEEE